MATEKTALQRTKDIFEKDDVKQRLQEMLGKKAPGFVTSVLSAMNSNQMLKNADPQSVYMAAMTAASLDLPINHNLGLAYIIPYNIRQQDNSYKQVAQFQIGYKGFIQLALRSGQFKTISATPVYEGQLISEDPLKGFEFDWTNKASDEVIGYAAYFELINGFEKTYYMTKQELEKHGGKYSKTYSKKNSIWQEDFNAMATKTVIKLLLSKYGPMSIEMQRAQISDQGVIKDYENLDLDYADNPRTEDIDHEELDPLIIRVGKMIEAATSPEDLEQLEADIQEIPEELQEKFNERKEQLSVTEG